MKLDPKGEAILHTPIKLDDMTRLVTTIAKDMFIDHPLGGAHHEMPRDSQPMWKHMLLHSADSGAPDDPLTMVMDDV